MCIVFDIAVFLNMDQSGVLDEKLQVGLLVAWMGLFALFSSRKFTQPIKVPSWFPLSTLLMMGSFQNVYGSRSEVCNR